MSILHLGPHERKTIAVGMGEMVVTDEAETDLICMGLGSCIAICAFVPRRGIGAIAHVVLPVAPATATVPTARYADQAVPLLITELRARGALVRGARVVLCGGAAIFPPSRDSMDIGARNLQRVSDELARAGLTVVATSVGGTSSRTITLQVGTGLVHIRTVQGKEPLVVDLSTSHR